MRHRVCSRPRGYEGLALGKAGMRSVCVSSQKLMSRSLEMVSYWWANAALCRTIFIAQTSRQSLDLCSQARGPLQVVLAGGDAESDQMDQMHPCGQGVGSRTIAHEPIAASPQRSHSPTPCRRQGVRPAVVLQQSPGVRHVMHRRCCAELHLAVVAAAHIHAHAHAHAHAHVIAVATYCEHSASQPCMVLSQWPPGHASLMEVDLTPSPRRSTNN